MQFMFGIIHPNVHMPAYTTSQSLKTTLLGHRYEARGMHTWPSKLMRSVNVMAICMGPLACRSLKGLGARLSDSIVRGHGGTLWEAHDQ